ncbi:hypothetical protein MAR_028666, partial [Mya arenaria]
NENFFRLYVVSKMGRRDVPNIVRLTNTEVGKERLYIYSAFSFYDVENENLNTTSKETESKKLQILTNGWKTIIEPIIGDHIKAPFICCLKLKNKNMFVKAKPLFAAIGSPFSSGENGLDKLSLRCETRLPPGAFDKISASFNRTSCSKDIIDYHEVEHIVFNK